MSPGFLYLSNLFLIASLSNVYCFSTNSGNILRSARKLNLDMKTRSGKVPIDARGEAVKRQKMMQAREEFKSKAPTDVPIFEIFVRPKIGGIWFPW